MARHPASLCLLALVAAAPQANAAKVISLQFTVSKTHGFDGMDSASLAVSKENLSGTVEVVSPGPATYPCAVNFGSTLIHDQLNLTCTIGPDEIVTLSGRLDPKTGTGKGTFSETFFREQGTYRAAGGT